MAVLASRDHRIAPGVLSAETSASLDVSIEKMLLAFADRSVSLEAYFRGVELSCAYVRTWRRCSETDCTAWAAAALVVASKVEDEIPLLLASAARLFEVKEDAVRDAEADILNSLGFDVFFPTAHHILDEMLRRANHGERVGRIAVAYACLLDALPGVARSAHPEDIARAALESAEGAATDDAPRAAAGEVAKRVGALFGKPDGEGFVRVEKALQAISEAPLRWMPRGCTSGREHARWAEKLIPTADFQAKRLLALGSGNFGVVYETDVTIKASGRKMAMKIIHTPSDVRGEGILAEGIRECAAMLAMVECPHVMKIIAAHAKPYMVKITMEVFGMDLRKFMFTDDHPLSAYEKRSILEQVLSAIVYAHERWVIHMDIKPGNILVERSPWGEISARLSDFGAGMFVKPHAARTRRLPRQAVTLWYRAPEVLLDLPYSNAVDMWSVGCIAMDMFGESTAFAWEGGYVKLDMDDDDDTLQIRKQLSVVFATVGSPTVHTWPEALASERWWAPDHEGEVEDAAFFKAAGEHEAAVRGLLAVNPQDRLSAVEALDMFKMK